MLVSSVSQHEDLLSIRRTLGTRRLPMTYRIVVRIPSTAFR